MTNANENHATRHIDNKQFSREERIIMKLSEWKGCDKNKTNMKMMMLMKETN